jgi:hypothetical protein
MRDDERGVDEEGWCIDTLPPVEEGDGRWLKLRWSPMPPPPKAKDATTKQAATAASETAVLRRSRGPTSRLTPQADKGQRRAGPETFEETEARLKRLYGESLNVCLTLPVAAATQRHQSHTQQRWAILPESQPTHLYSSGPSSSSCSVVPPRLLVFDTDGEIVSDEPPSLQDTYSRTHTRRGPS